MADKVVRRFSRLMRPDAVKKPRPKLIIDRKQSPCIFDSIPVEIIGEVISYLNYLERFNLKLVGNYRLTTRLLAFPRPSLQEYCDSFVTENYRVDVRQLGLSLDERFGLGYYVCRSGQNAILLKLLEAGVGFKPTENESVKSRRKAKKPTHGEDVVRQLTIWLELAAEEGHLSTVKILLAAGARNDNDKPAANALLVGAQNGHTEIVKLLLESGAVVTIPKFGEGPIMLAAKNGHATVLALLCKGVWRKSRKLSPVLALAAKNGHLEVMKLLFELGAKVMNSPDYPNRHELHEAAVGGNEDVFRLLLAHGATDTFTTRWDRDLSWSWTTAWCALHYAALCGNIEIVKIILDEDIVFPQMPHPEHEQERALALAAGKGHLPIVQLLLDREFSPNSVIDGLTALYLAAKGGHTAMISLLLKQGAQVDKLSLLHVRYVEPKVSPLHIAAYNGDLASVLILLDHGADVNASDGSGHTSLMMACSRSYNKAAELLINRGADVNAIDGAGDTALAKSIESRNIACATVVLEHGADTEIIGKKGRTAIHQATCHEASHLVPVLLQHGANIDARDDAGETPLHYAARRLDAKLVDVLIANNADRYARSHAGNTALHLAAERQSQPERLKTLTATLISYGLDAHDKNNEGMTPTELADESLKYHNFIMINQGALNYR